MLFAPSDQRRAKAQALKQFQTLVLVFKWQSVFLVWDTGESHNFCRLTKNPLLYN